MSRSSRSKQNRRGTATVEFALCFPVLLAFVFAIIEYSRVMQIQNTLRLAAFEGARAGVSLDSTTTSVQNSVNTVLTALSVGNSQTTISPNPLAYTSQSISVTVTADPAQNAWLTWFVTAGNPISSTVTLDREVKAVSSP